MKRKSLAFALATLVSLSFPVVGSAQLLSLDFVGHVGGNCEGVAVGDGFVYAGEGPRFLILDASSPLAPQRRSSILLPEVVRSVALTGSTAVVANGGAGVQFLNVSNPADPRIVGVFQSGTFVRSASVAGNRAWAAAGGAGVQGIDISDPSSPQLISSYNTTGFSHACVASGDRLLVADALEGLVVLRGAEGESLRFEARLDTPGETFAVQPYGDYLIVADGPAGVHAVDYSNPPNIRVVDTFDTLETAVGVTISGSLAYVSVGGSGVQILDLSNPANLRLVESQDTEGYADETAVARGALYVADGRGLRVINVADPSNPVPTSLLSTVPSNAEGVDVSEGRAFVADRSAEVVVVDAQQVETPRVLASFETSGSPRDLVVQGSLLHVADGAGELQLVDAANLNSPQLVGVFRTDYSARNVTRSGNLDFVSTSGCDDLGCYERVQIIDTTDVPRPRLRSTLRVSEHVPDVAVAGNTAYLAGGYARTLSIWDVTNPDAPAALGSVALGEYVSSVALLPSGRTAAVALGTGGVAFVDVSNPRQPRLLQSIDTPDSAFRLEVEGRLVYVADGASGVQVIDAANPRAPRLVGSYNTASAAREVYPMGNNLLAVADGRGGLLFLRVRGTLPEVEDRLVTDFTDPLQAPDWGTADILSPDGAPASFERIPGAGLRVTSHADQTFAFWGNIFSAPEYRAWRQPAAGNLYVIDWDVRSSVNGPDTPPLRLRYVSADSFYAANYIFVDVAGDGAGTSTVPGTVGRSYRTISTVPPHTTNNLAPNGFNLGFDVMHFAVGRPGSHTLRRITEWEVSPSAMGAGTALYSHTFEGNDPDIWEAAATNLGGIPVEYAVEDGLTVRTTGLVGTAGVSYGFWQTRRDALPALSSAKWYRLTATISGQASDPATNPVARVRFFAQNNEFACDFSLTPGVGDSTESPTGDGRTYTGWFSVPSGIDGQPIRLAFDVYDTYVERAASDDPALTLRGVELRSYDPPVE